MPLDYRPDEDFPVGALVTVTDTSNPGQATRARVPAVTVVDQSGNAVVSGATGQQPAVNSQSVTPASDTTPFPVVGNVAPGATDSGNPVKIGGYGSSAWPTAVSSGQRVNAWYNNYGASASFVIDLAGGTDGRTSNTGYFFARDGIGYSVSTYGAVFNGTTWDRQRGDITGAWVHGPPSAPVQQGGTIAASGGTATVTFVSTADTEIVNPSTATLWGSWGTPAVNGANSYPIAAGQSFRPPNRPVGTFTLLSTAANQIYTATRY